MQQIITESSSSFENEHVVSALWQLARLAQRGKITAAQSADVQSVIQQLLKLKALYKLQKHPGFLARVIYVLAYFGFRQRRFINPLLTYASRLFGKCDAHNLVLLIKGAAGLGVRPSPSWMQRFCDAVLAKSRYLTKHEMAPLLQALVAVHYKPDRLFVDTIGRRAQSLFGVMRPADMATCLDALACLQLVPSKEFFREFVEQSRSKLSGCSPRDMCSIAAAMQVGVLSTCISRCLVPLSIHCWPRDPKCGIFSRLNDTSVEMVLHVPATSGR